MNLNIVLQQLLTFMSLSCLSLSGSFGVLLNFLRYVNFKHSISYYDVW